jgi:hypothetical protein
VFVDKKRAPHFYFPEAGTKDRRTKKGAGRGKVTATPYIKPWREAAKARVTNEVTQPLVRELVATISKGLKV